MSADKFTQTPNLTALKIDSHDNNENVIRAIGSLKDRLQNLTMEFLGTTAGFDQESSSQLLFKQIGNFINLRHLQMGISWHNVIMPINIFANSAHCLETVRISHIKIPTVTSGMFKEMRKLKLLNLMGNDIEKIEDGAFDDLVELEEIDINMGKLQTLPDGLFKNMKKLKRVIVFGRNTIENISRQNFTHCDDFEEMVVAY